MVDNLGNIHGVPGATPLRPPVPGRDKAVPDGAEFKDILQHSIDEVNRLQKEADTAGRALINGETDNVAEVMTAVEKATKSFEMLMQVRNQLVEAYEEILRMRI